MNGFVKQEVFNKVYAALKAQDFNRSMGGSKTFKTCRYRGENGLKCAVGHLIPDDKYNNKFEGSTVIDADIAAAAGAKEDGDVYFLRNLQLAHDGSVSPSYMKTKLHNLAENYGLVVPE